MLSRSSSDDFEFVPVGKLTVISSSLVALARTTSAVVCIIAKSSVPVNVWSLEEHVCFTFVNVLLINVIVESMVYENMVYMCAEVLAQIVP